jgi:hypothetical protein
LAGAGIHPKGFQDGCPITTVGHDSQIDFRHYAEDMEQGANEPEISICCTFRFKNEYDASLFGDFRLNRQKVRLYGNSQKGISSESRSKEAGEEKSLPA